ncbi:HAD family hydrolase [Zunongwangia sp.]|uniref:HAD family hydrolase n=1 Tax=Zunongwangia sp. TaxID=1965325 RepID=UPI003AA8295F
MIKTIIFDFGDVFINLDKSATPTNLAKHGITKLPSHLANKNLQYEKGNLDSDTFIKEYQQTFTKLEKDEFLNAWNSILVDFPKYRLDFLKKLAASKQYLLILLSNTNEIHIDWVRENVEFFEEFKACFDAFYLSYEINFRKPDANIYEFVLKQHQLSAEECLFIDDTKENIETADKLGIKTWNINPEKEDVINLFSVKKDLFQ